MRIKTGDIRNISPKNSDFMSFDLTQFRPVTRFSKARMSLKADREVPVMESRSRLQTLVFRRYPGDLILLYAV
jgi:hypothetical protein